MVNNINIDLVKAHEYICKNCSKLYKVLFEYYFLEGSSISVINALKKYQNKDGGFGHGLEPDFMLPNSSPMATTIAQQILEDIEDIGLIKDILKYYEKTFDYNRNGWWSVPIEVNDYPHAPWWTYDEIQKSTVIDNHWGNPSSEIIGFLYKWRKYVKNIDISKVLEYSIDHLNNSMEIESEHEIYCYIRMFKNIEKKYQDKICLKLSTSIRELVCLDETKWTGYVPKPLDFIQSKEHPLFEEVKGFAEKHCNYLLDNIKDGIWFPTWEWGNYEKDWLKSKNNWIAVLTIKNYRILKNLNKLG